MLARSNARSLALWCGVLPLALALAGCPTDPAPVDAPVVPDAPMDAGRDAPSIDTSVPDGGTPCDDVKEPCSVAGTTCEGDHVVVCAADAEGCLAETSTDCGDTDQVCDDSGATPVCVDVCSLIPEADRCDTVDVRACNGEVLEMCTEDADGCLVLERMDCAAVAGGTCDETLATPACIMPPDPCEGTPGRCDVEGTMCFGAALETCAPNAFGCLVEARSNCGVRGGGTCDATMDPQACVFTGDPCVGITQCATEGTTCDGPTLVRCREDAYGCRVETRTNCSGAMFGYCDPDAADGAICAVSDTDPCEGIDECGTSASVTCTDGTTLSVCAADAMGCFVATVTDCAEVDGNICRTSGSTAACGPGVTCGDGLVEGTEACDDENTDDGDGCSSDCEVEDGWVCDDDEPSVCGTTCENLLQPTELDCATGTITLNTADGTLGVGDYSCSTYSYPGREQVLTFTNSLATTAEITIDSVRLAADGDYDLYVFEPSEDICGLGSCVTSGVDSGPNEDVTFTATAGQTFHVVYDIFNNAMATTEYTLEITCAAVVCGNGAVTSIEECDDGDTMGGDGCSATCEIEDGYVCPSSGGACHVIACGDGFLDGSEVCDDGDLMSGDGCSATCTVESGYECSGAPSVCVTVCGNGVINSGEACDDGNTTAGDGCVSCAVSPGYTCTGAPSVCRMPTCGDGTADYPAEACDDGNVIAGDGCSATCTVESTVVAMGTGLPLMVSEAVPAGVTSPATVAMACNVADVEATVTFNPGHSYTGDLIVELVSPAGTRVFLSNRVGGSQEFRGPYTFAVGGGGIAWPGTGGTFTDPPIAAGRYTTAGLSVLAGTPAMGTWNLAVRDLASGDSGTFASWSLAIRCMP